MTITELVKLYIDDQKSKEVTFTKEDLGLSIINIVMALEELNNLTITEDNKAYKYLKSWSKTGEKFKVTLTKVVENDEKRAV